METGLINQCALKIVTSDWGKQVPFHTLPCDHLHHTFVPTGTTICRQAIAQVELLTVTQNYYYTSSGTTLQRGHTHRFNISNGTIVAQLLLSSTEKQAA
uniref:Uncharacterized protein n=1 Tax=Ascaris lumbricoides TaxID=6252 RepID=A0A0M3I8R7_ASCLU